jgi:hypothetical protein
MKKIVSYSCWLIMLMAAFFADAANELTEAEKAAGWRLLFDGSTTKGWRGFQRTDVPTNGWVVADGCLKRIAKSCDLMTEETFLDFELTWEWKISKKGNSGVKYLVDEKRLDKKNGKVSTYPLGNEYQMLDDSAFPDLSRKNKTASWYSVLEAQGAEPKPAGEFNQSRIVVTGNHVEHWLNGVKVLEFELGTAATAEMIAKSNFKNVPGYAEKKRTPILLQDHGSAVWFRDIKIRELKTASARLDFTDGVIPPITVVSEGHVSTVKNGVKLDVYYDNGPKSNVAIYAINTGRKQLVLTPEKHRAILENLIKKKFTVIVADFRDKKLKGLELEKYVVQLTADAREAAASRTETYAKDYFTLMPGFTVERDVTWFRYGDIPEPFRKEIARHLGKPFREADADIVNTYDIVYPVYGPDVGVLTNYGSNEKGREEYYPREITYLVMAFAFKNLAIVHQQYFNDPVGGYPKGYGYYGDQFAVNFIRHLKGNAAMYHLDTQKICCFGHSKGSQVPGMLLNKLRGTAPYLTAKVDWNKLSLSETDKTIPSPFANLSTEIACAILGAGIANSELGNDKLMPWTNNPVKNISPFFLYADHRADTRQATTKTVAKAKANGVIVETVELSAHTWPVGAAYDAASTFIDRILRLDY